MTFYEYFNAYYTTYSKMNNETLNVSKMSFKRIFVRIIIYVYKLYV